MYRFLCRFLRMGWLQRTRVFCSVFCCGLLLAGIAANPSRFIGADASAIAQEPMAESPTQSVQSGVESYQSGDYLDAISDWLRALNAYPISAVAERAIVNENLARAYQQIGDTVAALTYWQAAADSYQASDNVTQFGRMLTEQAQTYISQGQHQRAVALLCGEKEMVDVEVACTGGAYAIAQAEADLTGQVAALGSLAESYRLQGLYAQAETLLMEGLTLVDGNDLAQYKAPMLNSLGNVYIQQSRIMSRRAESASLFNLVQDSLDLQAQSEQSAETAMDYFNQAAAATPANDLSTELHTQMNLLLLNQQNAAQQSSQNTLSLLRQRIGELIKQLPSSRETAYAAITLAKSYRAAEQDFSCDRYEERAQIQTWLETSRQIAETIQDARAESFALGELGHLEECRGRLDEATRFTQQAQLAAGDALASADSLYLWEWQMGRIYNAQGDLPQAQVAYTQSLATLRDIRTDILTADRELQFDFRDTVDPVYRQAIALQLDETPLAPQRVEQTLATIDDLRLAELQNFFGNDCVLVANDDVRDRLLGEDFGTTVINSIVLPDRVVLIATFPDDTTQKVEIGDFAMLRTTAGEFRSGLKRYTDRVYDSAPAEFLYQEMIQPFEARLVATQTQTLVFVQDGFLRNVPMAALYDGDRYLIERYAIATTPSLNLTATNISSNNNLRALAVGLSQRATTDSGRGFPALTSVPDELASISQQLPGSKVLIDQAFTKDTLTEALAEDAYSILHLATHGQFSTIPEETFVVTGPSSLGIAGELTFGELETLIRQASPQADPLDLITLTACETATGDDRATLGLAGVAVRAGARSAIASLWKVDDETAATLITRFYSSLQQPYSSKARALQLAQVAAIEDDRNANPGKWAPLILVGNWQ